MSNILTIDELKNSVLNANIDDEYIQPAIDEAQSIYLREILGDALLNAVINKINGNNLTGKYLTLVNEYIKPYLTYMVQSIIVVPITYKIRNAGVIQQYDNGFTSTQMKDTQYLKDYYDGKAEFYGNRLTEYLKKNASDIVEYRLSASNVTNPTTSQNVTNIFLGGTKRGKCGGMIPSGGGTHDTVDWDDITNRPDFATVATSGDYNDLNNLPDLFSGDYNDLTNKPELFSGDYNDLSNKPNFATVATSGSYNDLSNTPQLATVATTGDYSDLSNTPDLNDYVDVDTYNQQMQNIDNALADKVDVGTYNNKMSAVDSALADKVETGNLCRINNERLDINSNFELVRTDSIATLTITQGGTTKGTFTPDSGTDVTINLDAGGSGSTDWSDITNKPSFATVATSGSYSDLSNTPSLATVATSGSYNDLSNKPTLATVATSGDYGDLNNKPTLAQVATSGDYRDLNNTPNLGAVATSNDYRDLDYKPTIITPVQADWDETDSSQLSFIKDKPTFAQVATSGDYRDLSNTPNFAAVATSGDYHDLIHTPTIVTPVNANWNETDPSELSYIQGKPSLAQVATSGDYGDLSNTPNLGAVATSNDYDDLDNKPTIPTVNNATLTINQGGTTKGTFTANAGTDVTINLDAGGSGSTDWSDITNKPSFATVATSGSYNDLSNKPSLANVATSGSYNDLSNTPSLATVATSGSYNDLSNKPTIPDDETDLGLTTETWTFTLQDSSTVTKQVVIKPTV